MAKFNFSFQSQRRVMPKNVQATTQLHSFHMLTMSCSKSSKLDFNSMWTENFRCTSWILKKQRNQRSNCQHLLDQRKSKGIPKSNLLHWLHESLWPWITTNCGEEMCVWVSGIGLCSVETASEKRSPRTSYPPGWDALSINKHRTSLEQRLSNISEGKFIRIYLLSFYFWA